MSSENICICKISLIVHSDALESKEVDIASVSSAYCFSYKSWMQRSILSYIFPIVIVFHALYLN